MSTTDQQTALRGVIAHGIQPHWTTGECRLDPAEALQGLPGKHDDEGLDGHLSLC